MALPRHTRTFAKIPVAVGLATALAVHCVAEEPAIDGVLVLRNGNVLVGAIARHGPEYQIRRATSMLRVPADQVERFASSLREVYESRRAELVGKTPEAHLELANWCLRVALLDEAARELLDVRALDARLPGLADAELRLRQLIGQQAEHVAPVNAPGVDMADETSAEPPTPLIAISAEAQVRFVRSIQPMLINSCTNGGCHHPDSARPMKLDRWALRGNGDAELVRRNLNAVLSQINVDDAPSSDLVLRGRTPHGLAEHGGSRPLSAHQAMLLIEWVNEVAGARSEAPPPLPQEIVSGSGMGELAAPAMEYPTDEILNAMTLEELQLAAERAELSDAEIGAPKARFVPRDAFDPDIFNRRRDSRATARASAESDGAEAPLGFDQSAGAAGAAVEDPPALEP
jgi:hypothetical protein